MMRQAVAKAAKRVAFNVFSWLAVLLIAFPLIWMILTSLKPRTELFIRPPTMLPNIYTLEHYMTLIWNTPFPIFFKNSAIVAMATTTLVIVVATLGAHSLVNFRYRGRRLMAQMILFTYLLPSVVLAIPIYLIMAWLGLVNSLLSLVIAYTTFALPFALWLLRSFMAAIPPDLESAAMVDGATRMRAFFDVIVPQALPGIISTAIFTFILSWNEYLYALILMTAVEKQTLPPGSITMLIYGFNVEWALVMAASVMMSVPLVVIFVFLQKHLTRGFGAGAVKG